MSPRPARLGRLLIGLLAVATWAAGCRAPETSIAADPPARRKASADPSPRGSTGTTPVPSVVVAATSTPTPVMVSSTPALPPVPLRRPAGASTLLHGAVVLDAAYALGIGAAVLANNGGSMVATGSLGLLSNNGGGLIANNGGSLIAVDGAALLANNGAGVVANNGAGVVANNGAGVVANNGAGVVANNGAGAAAGATRAFGLLQAPGVGDVLPAGGVVLGVFSLRDGAPVSLGEDAQGAPVFAVFTDAAGAYEVFVPADVGGNVLVQVRFPRLITAEADARLAYDVIDPGSGTGAGQIDEDTALATRYVFDAFAGRFRDFLTTSDPAETARALTSEWVGAPPALQQLMLGLVQEFSEEAKKVGLNTAPPAEVQRIARRIIETAMAPVDLDSIVVTKASNALWKWPDEPALAGVIAALRALRVAATVSMATKPGDIERQPWFVAANAGRQVPIQIKKPADLGEFVVAEYYVRDMSGSYAHARVVFTSLSALTEPGTGIDQVDRISAASSAILASLGQSLITDQGGAKSAALQIVKEWKPGSQP